MPSGEQISGAPNYGAIFDARGGAYHRAMTQLPAVRAAEFELIVRHGALEPGMLMLDVPSGGGYLAPYVAPHLQPQGRCRHVETSKTFFEAAQKECRDVVHAPSLSELPFADASVDLIVSLAGLHHETERLPFYREARRILRPDRRLLIAEVEEGSAIARFLDGFVDAHGDGHRGDYLGAPELDLLGAAGLVVDSVETQPTPWRACSVEELGWFCRELFRVHRATVDDVLEALRTTIGVRPTHQGVELAWELRLISCRARAC